MLTYLKHDFSRIRKVVIGFAIVIIILSVVLGLCSKNTGIYTKKRDIFDTEYQKIYNERLVEKESFQIARKNIIKEKGFDIEEINKKYNIYGWVNLILMIAIGTFILLFIGYSIMKFKEDLFTEKGYLIFSLPIKTIDILITKYITGIVIPMFILGIGYFIVLKIGGEQKNITSELIEVFYLSTNIIAFITISYMYLALSKIGSRFFEKMFAVFILLSAIIIIIISIGMFIQYIFEDFKIMGIMFSTISIVAAFVTERTIRKRLTI